VNGLPEIIVVVIVIIDHFKYMMKSDASSFKVTYLTNPLSFKAFPKLLYACGWSFSEKYERFQCNINTAVPIKIIRIAVDAR